MPLPLTPPTLLPPPTTLSPAGQAGIRPLTSASDSLCSSRWLLAIRSARVHLSSFENWWCIHVERFGEHVFFFLLLLLFLDINLKHDLPFFFLKKVTKIEVIWMRVLLNNSDVAGLPYQCSDRRRLPQALFAFAQCLFCRLGRVFVTFRPGYSRL